MPARRAVAAREDGNLPLRIDGDARGFAEIHVGRQLEEIDVAVERNFGHGCRARTGVRRRNGRANGHDPQTPHFSCRPQPTRSGGEILGKADRLRASAESRTIVPR